MRVVKHLGARVTPADDHKVLMAIPTFPGERITGLSMSCYFASGAASAIDQPGELNWMGISIPWSLVFATNMMNAGGAPEAFAGVPAIDKIYGQYLVATDEGSGEKFGGDDDADPEDKSGEEGHVNEELLNAGPIGVHSWFRREVLMAPFAAEGNTVIRFGDSFGASGISIPAHAMGGLTLFGMVRYNVDVETNFNVEMDTTVSREGLGLLIGGDYTTVNARIEGDTSSAGDFLRTVLFGGDNFIETNTIKAPAGNSFVKAVAFIESAISRRH